MATDEVEIVDLHDGHLSKLVALLEKKATSDGDFYLLEDKTDGPYIARSSKVSDYKICATSRPGICIVAQGAKTVSLAQDSFLYNSSNMVIYAAEVPISVKITQASVSKPYLCLVIPLDLRKLSDLILRVFPGGVSKSKDLAAIYVGEHDINIIQAAARMMELVDNQEDADLLVPLVIEEIIIRLLRSGRGEDIAQIGINDSHAQKISKVISWLKDNYASSVRVEDLAKIAGMSSTSFHAHFKALTSMSPLQFQKTLRLQEARYLMATHMLDVSSVAFKVGYASTSQFSREYAREFGASPSKDIQNIRVSQE